MRKRERERAQAKLRRLIEDHYGPNLSERVTIVWCLDLPEGEYGIAVSFAPEAQIVFINVDLWRREPHNREDTLIHEAAHLIAWHVHGHEIPYHGREWRRWYRKLGGKRGRKMSSG